MSRQPTPRPPRWSPGFEKVFSVQPSLHKLLLTSQPRRSSCPHRHWSPLSEGPCRPHSPGAQLVSLSVVHTQTPAPWELGEAKPHPTLSSSVFTPRMVSSAVTSPPGGCVQLLPALPAFTSRCSDPYGDRIGLLAAMTKYPRLKPQKCVSSQFWKLESEIKVLAGLGSPEASVLVL